MGQAVIGMFTLEKMENISKNNEKSILQGKMQGKGLIPRYINNSFFISSICIFFTNRVK
jgi:hypothetical protein